MPKNKGKKPRKNKFEGIDIEERDVPMYRAYGKARREYPNLERLAERVFQGVLIYLIVWFGFILCLIIYSALAFSNVSAFFVLVTASAVLIILASRTPAKRLSFISRLKRTCKKNGWELTEKRRFFASFIWNKDAVEDFSVWTGTRRYLVKYATAVKKNSDMIFLSGHEMLYRRLRSNNKFVQAFDLQPIVKKMDINFPEVSDFEDVSNIILLNPVPMEIYIKDRDGCIVSSGSGEDAFGYTVFSGSGFLSQLERENEPRKRVHFE